MKQNLYPSFENLLSESVLMQAWKKTSNYLRYHSWYADTFEIDYQSLRVGDFIREIQCRLIESTGWEPLPLKLVPAPKGQSWHIVDGKWKPQSRENVRKKIRPLAHLDLQDQVLATAMLLCLGDRVEESLGNPLLTVEDSENRKRVLAYGHRLFCDTKHERMRHRWGSTKLYRLYYQDYQTFLSRPEKVAKQLSEKNPSREVAVVHSDLSKFYDRVDRELLIKGVETFLKGHDENAFLEVFSKLFNWNWQDNMRASEYAKVHDIENFSPVVLPQGLVAAGFFANVALTGFDRATRKQLNSLIDEENDIILSDICYYVDDLRIVLSVKSGLDEKLIEESVTKWLETLLNQHANGLLIEPSKTKAKVEGRGRQFWVPQSKTANRIQRDVSGPFDMLHGSELIGAIEGFFHTQKRYSSNLEESGDDQTGILLGMSDMRDDTAARFAAGRFRKTFRSLRPLLHEEGEHIQRSELGGEAIEDVTSGSPSRLVLSREQLDERGQLFAAMLIDEWVSNPTNVRLLRIALDLYPDPRILDRVLDLLKPCWQSKGGTRGSGREVQQYCLAELFRAGATETGIVKDNDCLPVVVDIENYHQRLAREGIDILNASLDHPNSTIRFPWYLMQQVFLYLIVRDRISESIALSLKGRSRRGLERYYCFVRFIGNAIRLKLSERAIFLIYAQTGFGLEKILERALKRRVSPEFLKQIYRISPSVAKGVWASVRETASEGQATAARSLGLELPKGSSVQTVANIAAIQPNPFWEERNLLKLAEALLEKDSQWPDYLSPWQITCSMNKMNGDCFGELEDNSVKFVSSHIRGLELFKVPDWCETKDEKQKYQLGMILRFALRGSVDFYTANYNRRSSNFHSYRLTISHWEKERYSGFQGRSAFGPPWIPISSWTEELLFELLRWPGAGIFSKVIPLSELYNRVRKRLKEIEQAFGRASKLGFLEQVASWPGQQPIRWNRPLRIGIVQSVIPDENDYFSKLNDPELISCPIFRRRQRRHLATLLEGVVQLLQVRESHIKQNREDGRIIDLLIFPELAIHPDDYNSLILPFVRTYKCIILYGQVYHPAYKSRTSFLINSCMWAIPEWTSASGFQVRLIEQGKKNLTNDELKFHPKPVGFRPVQWIIEYRWSSDHKEKPLRLSASVCYDATDISLASDLASRSDLYVICALNKDVGTFDRMSEGLHYHMFQGVIVVNNGQYGGSSFFMPFKQIFQRQVFHLHGQPQANVLFAEISPEKLINRPKTMKNGFPKGEWKTPPAGLKF